MACRSQGPPKRRRSWRKSPTSPTYTPTEKFKGRGRLTDKMLKGRWGMRRWGCPPLSPIPAMRFGAKFTAHPTASAAKRSNAVCEKTGDCCSPPKRRRRGRLTDKMLKGRWGMGVPASIPHTLIQSPRHQLGLMV